MTLQDSDVTASDAPSLVKKTRPRRRRILQPFKRSTVLLHRWSSIVLGLLLIVITTSGALVIYSPEWTKWTNSAAFHVTRSAKPIPATDAIAIVAKAHPDFTPGTVNVYGGLYEVFSSDEKRTSFYGVDPGTGRITGQVHPNRGVMAFMLQVHECFFTCEDHPGYIPFLNDHVPTLGMHCSKT